MLNTAGSCIISSKKDKISLRKKGLTKVSACAIICRHSGSAPQYRGVEQLEARRAHNPEVVGSSPASATIRKDLLS